MQDLPSRLLVIFPHASNVKFDVNLSLSLFPLLLVLLLLLWLTDRAISLLCVPIPETNRRMNNCPPVS